MPLTHGKCLMNSSNDFHPPGPLPHSLGGGQGLHSYLNPPIPLAMSQVPTHLYCLCNETFYPQTASQTDFFRLK